MQGHGAEDGQGDPGGGLRCSARRGGGDDTEEAGGERASGARGGAVASDVLPGGVACGVGISSLKRPLYYWWPDHCLLPLRLDRRS